MIERTPSRGWGLGAAAIIVLLYLAIATLWSLVVPLGEGPDEAAHFDYALFVARTHRLPLQTVHGGDVPGEGHQPPLAYWLMQPAVRFLSASALTLQVKTNPHFLWAGGSQINAYVHGGREAAPYTGQVLAWHLARGLSSLLGAVTVALCWLTARLVVPTRSRLAVAAAALVAFNPQFIFQHVLVSNDPLLIVLSSLLIFGCIAAVRVSRHWQKPWFWWPTGFGLVLGLLLLTKQSALVLVPLPILALGLCRRRWQQWVRDSLLTLTVAFLVSGWWYVRNDRAYGDPFGAQIFQQTFAAGDFHLASLANWRAGAWSLLRSSWGVFGWQTLSLSDGAYWLFLLIVVLGLIGLTRTLATRTWHNQTRVIALLAAALGLVFLWTLAFAQTVGMAAWQGRFLFPAIVPLSIGLACGWAALLPRGAGLVTIPTGLLLVAGSLPFGLLGPAYPVYARTSAQVQVGTRYGAFDWGWKRGAELRGATFPATVPAGQQLPLKLTWHAVAPLDRPWTVFVHVVDDHGTVVAHTNAQPLDGRFPTDAWEINDWIEDPKQVDLAGVAPGHYRVRIGLFDPKTSERLGVYDRERQQLGDYLVVGTLTVQPPN